MSALPESLQHDLRQLTAHVLGLRHAGLPLDQIHAYIDDTGARLLHVGLPTQAVGTLASSLAAIRALAG